MAEIGDTIADAAQDIITDMTTEEFVTTGRRWIGLGVVLGLAVGGGISFWFTRRYLETKYEKVAEEEIAQMRDHFRKRVVAKEAKPELSALGRDLGYRENSDIPDVVIPEGIKPNVPLPPRPSGKVVEHGWDYEVEKSFRTPEKPYVIHVDERHEAEDHEEITLTYYAADDILCDHEDKVVDDQERVVGIANLDKFGHGSQDKNIVYIRNEYLSLDIEVCRSDRSYAEDVHGFSHSDTPRRRRRVEWDE